MEYEIREMGWVVVMLVSTIVASGDLKELFTYVPGFWSAKDLNSTVLTPMMNDNSFDLRYRKKVSFRYCMEKVTIYNN